MTSLFIILIVSLIIIALLIYNTLIKSRNEVNEAWSGIDIQLKRRADLIPNLVETVKGYAQHEKAVFENVTKARMTLMEAQGPQNSASANDQLSLTIKSIFAVAENYPQLKASDNFLNLQNQLGDTEDRIAYSRQYYNSIVEGYNTKINTIPNNIFAGVLGFQNAEFFKATA